MKAKSSRIDMAQVTPDTGLLDLIVSSGYEATEQQVEQLARANISAVHTCDQISGSYFKILLVACQSALKPKHQGKRLDAMAAITNTEAPLYAAVLRGITTLDVASDPAVDSAERSRRALERNRRSAFARSAKSLIVNFVRAGGEMRRVDPSISKEQMRQMTIDLKPETDSQDRLNEFISSQGDTLKRAIIRLAKLDQEDAIAATQGMLSSLTSVLSGFGFSRAKTASQAAKELRPLNVEGTDFWPVARIADAATSSASVQ